MENLDPNVINDDLIRSCIQLEGQTEGLEEKRKNTDFNEVEILSFSFKSVLKVDNLRGLVNLTKLQLDNNMISKIENLDHLVNLKWLDLSFNQIAKINGLDKLTKLTDVSFFANRIETIEGLDTLSQLNVLSIGNNLIEQLETVMYLRRFKNLRLVNLAGNPMCRDPEYRSYVLSHVKNLKYLDYRLVEDSTVSAAREQYQDEMIELEEKEEQEEQKEKMETERQAHLKLMAEANMAGVETLFEDMLRDDPEFSKLRLVPTLTDNLNEFRDKYNSYTEDFRTLMLENYEKKKEERQLWQKTVDKATITKDEEARHLIIEFERMKKRMFREIRDDPGAAELKLQLPRQENQNLRDKLMELEMQTVEIVSELCGEFERNYSELVDGNKGQYNGYFAQIRDLENAYFETVSVHAMSLLDEYAQGKMEDIHDEARTLLQDKDTLLNAIQASHDAHTSKIDGLEDILVQQEIKRFNDMISSDKAWENKRNRDRISEIWNLSDRNKAEIEEMMALEDNTNE
mmetsp:Transcript_22613/g.27292  ORF Transcript_22613/g.27292 Transcript_22613/m.27292 type:complete len:515 (-) Transcript_22613:220-1764(-)|eukprot:CAMPEP_0197861596 /NCGR_PEP_ID=MMETSP1438-20131217/37763_1 /TAXON_ID=1461541 /ORGANISM="Pterosperma sp., Strain CCMP1384" /LENGTH=514 /DNA_ID=CAMNT_0043478823 /DNA_START=233 /DNA_END=1777 /DNA_ORIENTATION=+